MLASWIWPKPQTGPHLHRRGIRLFGAAASRWWVALPQCQDRIVGAIGVIGPTRINYGKIIRGRRLHRA